MRGKGAPVPGAASLTWRGAFAASPGPRGPRQVLVLALKGLGMGTADIIPGVSGGTVALITGIYAELIAAVRSLDARALALLLRGRPKASLAGVHLRFLLCLGSGILAALVSLAQLLHYLLEWHAVPLRGLFLGLIAASVWVVGRRVARWSFREGLGFAAGAAGGLWLVTRIPGATPETAAMIFFSGTLAICAMILPGISGAFILLLLGKYHFVTACLKNPLDPGSAVTIAIFAAGCLVGLLSFVRLLNLLLRRLPNDTLALLTGLMAGSLPKIWPWRAADPHGLATLVALPARVDGPLWVTGGLMLAGAAAVIVLERQAGR